MTGLELKKITFVIFDASQWMVNRSLNDTLEGSEDKSAHSGLVTVAQSNRCCLCSARAQVPSLAGTLDYIIWPSAGSWALALIPDLGIPHAMGLPKKKIKTYINLKMHVLHRPNFAFPVTLRFPSPTLKLRLSVNCAVTAWGLRSSRIQPRP